jgi:ATP-dependent protease ClpP protease subunit
LQSIQNDNARCTAFYAAKTGKTAKAVEKWLNTESIMDTDTAIQNGLITEVRPLVVPDGAYFHQVII